MTVAGSNTTTSAAIPDASRPRSTIPMVAAGSPVIFRTASSQVSTCCSRTYRPSTRGNVPKARGWFATAATAPQSHTMDDVGYLQDLDEIRLDAESGDHAWIATFEQPHHRFTGADLHLAHHGRQFLFRLRQRDACGAATEAGDHGDFRLSSRSGPEALDRRNV